MTTIDHSNTLPETFGQGWMTQEARELVRVATAIGHYDRDEIVRRLAAAPAYGRKINAATVGRILDAMRNES